MARETQTDRLNRIEDKLDKLSEAIISLARAEEKISQMEKFLHQQMEMLVFILGCSMPHMQRLYLKTLI